MTTTFPSAEINESSTFYEVDDALFHHDATGYYLAVDRLPAGWEAERDRLIALWTAKAPEAHAKAVANKLANQKKAGIMGFFRNIFRKK